MTEPSKLTVLQHRISTIAWVATLLLSIRGLFDFYGMKQKGIFEQIVSFATEPIVQLFQFKSVDQLQIPGLSVLFAAIFVLILSYVLQLVLSVKNTQLYRRKLHLLLAQQAIKATR